MYYTAYVLTEESKNAVLKKFPPKFVHIKAEHITIDFGVAAETTLPQNPKSIEIIGYSTDNEGLEALVVSIDGKLKRADGNFYHLTLSYDPSKKASPLFDLAANPEKRKEKPYSSAHSNGIIREKGFKPLETAIPLQAFPAILVK